MRYYLLPLFYSLIVGCDNTPKTIEIIAPPDYGNERAIYAYEAAALQNSSPITPDNPKPPSPKGKCETCNGVGKIDFDHDGKYDSICTACDGDGLLGEPMNSEEAKLAIERIKKLVEGVLPKTPSVTEQPKEAEPISSCYLMFQETKYIWDKEKLQFVSETNPLDCITLSNYYESAISNGTIIEMDVDGRTIQLEIKKE